MLRRWWEHPDWFGGGGSSDSEQLKRIERKVDAIMSTLEELTAVLGEIGTEVDKVSADTDSLLAKLAAIPAAGLTPEQQAALDAAVASATGIKDRLTALDAKVPDAAPAAAPTTDAPPAG